MSLIAKLRARRREKVGEIRTLLDNADVDKRELSDDERTKKEALYAEIENIDKRIADEEKLEELAKSSMTEAEQRAAGVTVVRDENDDENGKPKKLFKNLGEQLVAVRQASLPNGKVDERLDIISRAATGLNESVGADGGFLVQPDFSNVLMERAIETALLAPLVDSMPVSGNGLTVNSLDDYDQRDGYQFGGVQAYWENEADLKTASKPKFSQMSWKLKKLIGMCYATDEVLEDAPALTGIIERAFKSVFAFKLDQAIIWGNGTAQPLGFMRSPALVTQAKESSQSAAGVATENVVKMFSRLHSGARADAVWLINQDIEPFLYTMFVAFGANSGYPLYVPTGGMSGYPYGTLLGRRVIPIPHMKTMGTLGDIALVSPKEYLLITKGGIKQDVSMHVRFIYDETAYRFVLRVDGAPKWSTTMTPTEGSNSQSPFVTLAVRP